MTRKLTLISHYLCPYVQRAVISLTQKGVPFERRYVDLSNKPDWFLEVSPLGKTPVLLVDDMPIFESAVILEYLEDTQVLPLHPADPLVRSRHRAWIEFGSAILNDIAGFYNAKDPASLATKIDALSAKFDRVEQELASAAPRGGPFFAGREFSLVDAVYGPVFRYFDTFDQIGNFGILAGKPSVQAWRKTLSQRPSIRNAVTPDYPARLHRFIVDRQSCLSELAAMSPNLPALSTRAEPSPSRSRLHA